MRTLEQLRKEIDDIDKQLKALLDSRFTLSGEVGSFKKQQGLPVKDAQREQRILTSIQEDSALKHGGEISRVYHAIFQASRELQE